jgi:phosphoribosylglycinamide formyltransferase-1
MKRVVILTGGELRHTFFRKGVAMAPGIEVVRSYCEGSGKKLHHPAAASEEDGLRLKHLAAREQSERDFFGSLIALTPDRSNCVPLTKGAINELRHAQDIEALRPDILVAYGCSIIREPLLSAFQGRFLNVHLGLSPYYRGSGTNFWALVNGEPEYVGATFMYIAADVDAGEIIHQIRARVFPGDSPHQIGNRLISDMTVVCAAIIRCFGALDAMPQIPVSGETRLYRRKDFSGEATRQLYELFAEGLIERYLAEQESRVARAPIVVNPSISVNGVT